MRGDENELSPMRVETGITAVILYLKGKKI
jgi:hypothetical protein